jgi:hypothetical protein
MARRKSSKNLISRAPYPQSVRDQARLLFLDGNQMERISELLSVPVGTLRNWSSEAEISWSTERQERDRGLLEDAFSKRKLVASKVTSASLDQLDRAVQAITERALPLSISEAEKLANVYSVLEKQSRLDAGAATANVNVNAKVRLTMEDIKEILKNDPLVE